MFRLQLLYQIILCQYKKSSTVQIFLLPQIAPPHLRDKNPTPA
jgi:hypothetical protein